MHIVIDDRERPSGIIEVFSELKKKSLGKSDFTFEEDRLSIGDYQVDDKLIFERKTLLDFVASIIDGRLFSQASRLASSDLKAVLILEGTAKDLMNSEMQRESIQGAIVSISLIFNYQYYAL